MGGEVIRDRLKNMDLVSLAKELRQALTPVSTQDSVAVKKRPLSIAAQRKYINRLKVWKRAIQNFVYKIVFT